MSPIPLNQRPVDIRLIESKSRSFCFSTCSFDSAHSSNEFNPFDFIQFSFIFRSVFVHFLQFICGFAFLIRCARTRVTHAFARRVRCTVFQAPNIYRPNSVRNPNLGGHFRTSRQPKACGLHHGHTTQSDFNRFSSNPFVALVALPFSHNFVHLILTIRAYQLSAKKRFVSSFPFAFGHVHFHPLLPCLDRFSHVLQHYLSCVSSQVCRHSLLAVRLTRTRPRIPLIKRLADAFGGILERISFHIRDDLWLVPIVSISRFRFSLIKQNRLTAVGSLVLDQIHPCPSYSLPQRCNAARFPYTF